MKLKSTIIASIILLIIFSGCSFNYSVSGKHINYEKDAKELSIAKKSLQYIVESKTDSLKKMLNVGILKKTRADQLGWLIKKGKFIIQNNEYPNDSIITVSYITKESMFGKEEFKEFKFPFINKNDPDSTMYFNISIANGKIYKLILSTEMRIIK